MSTLLGYLVGNHGEFSGVRFEITDKGLIIGRDPSQVNVVIGHTLVSRRHAQIGLGSDGKLYLADLSSRNGTSVNGRRITAPFALSVGDKLDFGGKNEAVFVFETANDPSITEVLRQAFGENSASVDWKIGDKILGIYEVTGILGQGGMGRVYKVHHKSWGMDLAVKSPLAGMFSKKETVENFVREAETWVNLNLHPNIVQCHYVRTIGGIPRIFSEYVAGGSLHDWIAKKKLTQIDQILDVAIQFAWGLHAAHEQGLVHQDVKPLNVLMTPDGIAKVSDFGLAKAKLAVEGTTATGHDNMVTMAGAFTQAFCSPEQASSKRLSRKTDIWSWAVSVLQMFTGGIVWQNGLQAPQVLKAYRSLLGPKFVVRMPKELAQLLEHCLATRPDDRPKNLQMIAAELEDIYKQNCDSRYFRSQPMAASHLADGMNNRALSLLDLGQQELAEVALQEALKMEPHHPESCFNYGLLRWRSARITDEDFIKEMEEARLSHTDSWTGQYLLAMVHIERGDIVSASALLNNLSERQIEDELISSALASMPRRSANPLVREFTGHSDMVNSLSLGSDGRRMLSGSCDTTLRLWELSSGKCLQTFLGHSSGVNSVCLSTDGRWALSGSGDFKGSDNTVRLWELDSGRCKRILRGHSAEVNTVCLSPNGRWAISGSRDKTVRLWDLLNGDCVRVFPNLSESVQSVCLSADGRWVLVGSDETLRLLDVSTGELIRPLKGHSLSVISVCLSADGRSALSGSYDKTLRVWDVDSGKCVRTFQAQTQWVTSVCLSSNRRWALCGAYDNTLKVWDVFSGKCLRTFCGHADFISSVSMSADCRWAVSGSWDKTLRLWDLTQVWTARSREVPFILSRPSRNQDMFTAHTEFQKRLVSARNASHMDDVSTILRELRAARSIRGFERHPDALRLWNTTGRKGRRTALRGAWNSLTLEGHLDNVTSVSMSTDGRLALSGSYDETVRLWDLDTGECVRIFQGHSNLVNSVFLSADGHWALSGSSDNTLRLWDVSNGRCERTFQGHSDRVDSVCLSPDGHWALSASHDRTLRLWHVSSGRCVRTFQGHTEPVFACFSADGRLALLGGWGKTLRFWELDCGECVRTFEVPSGHSHYICMSADCRWVLSQSRVNVRDSVLRLWDIASRNCINTFQGYSQSITSAYLSADSLWILSGGYDKSLRLWNVLSGECVRKFEGHSSDVGSVCMSTDSCWALSGGSDNTIRLWHLDWDYEFPVLADWNEGARPYLQHFLALHTPYAADLPQNRPPTEHEIASALTRCGTPTWSDADFQKLLHTLGGIGYGWLKPEGVRHELEKMASNWENPPIL